MSKLKPVMFAVLAGLPFAILPAMAQNSTPAPAQGAAGSTRRMESTPSTTATAPSSGAYSSTSQSEHLPMTNHEELDWSDAGPNRRWDQQRWRCEIGR